MMYRWPVGTLSATCFCLMFSYQANGQQPSPLTWQGEKAQAPSFQSPAAGASSQQPANGAGPQTSPAADRQQQPPARRQALKKPRPQQPDRANTQEIPAVWPQEEPAPVPRPAVQTQQPEQTREQLAPSPVAIPAAATVPGYLGANTRNFYREHFCMHALTIRGVEVETVLPDSPAARAGLRPAREFTTRETTLAAAAGLLTLTPVAAVAPAFVRWGGGVPHGDIILAVNGRRVSNQNEFQNEIQRVGPQATAYLTVHRGETNVQIPVRLTEWPASVYANAQ